MGLTTIPMLVADNAVAQVPGKQSVHDAACSSDQVPALQVRHVVIDVAAITEDHVPDMKITKRS